MTAHAQPVADSPPSDGSLVRRFRRGEQDAATQLYLRYAQRLEKLAREGRGRALGARFDAEDVVQSVFRTFFRRAAQGEYELPEGEELWRLILVIALNKLRALSIHHRAAKRNAERTTFLDRWSDQPAADGGNEAAFATLHMAIDDLLHDLPNAHRQMIEMRIEGYEVAEVARAAGRSQRTVERVLQNFRERLSRLIHD